MPHIADKFSQNLRLITTSIRCVWFSTQISREQGSKTNQNLWINSLVLQNWNTNTQKIWFKLYSMYWGWEIVGFKYPPPLCLSLNPIQLTYTCCFECCGLMKTLVSCFRWRFLLLSIAVISVGTGNPWPRFPVVLAKARLAFSSIHRGSAVTPSKGKLLHFQCPTWRAPERHNNQIALGGGLKLWSSESFLSKLWIFWNFLWTEKCTFLYQTTNICSQCQGRWCSLSVCKN